jgi:hypothetical protein
MPAALVAGMDAPSYEDAVRSISELRRALAYEAEILNVHLMYQSFPTRPRVIAEKLVLEMARAAAGDMPAGPRSTNGAERAADEVSDLRRMLANSAEMIDGFLVYKTFPRSRRTVAAEQVSRMLDAADGRVQHAYGGISTSSLNRALRNAGGCR